MDARAGMVRLSGLTYTCACEEGLRGKLLGLLVWEKVGQVVDEPCSCVWCLSWAGSQSRGIGWNEKDFTAGYGASLMGLSAVGCTVD